MKAPPAAQDGIVYFSNTKGFVNALDAETGELTGEKELNGALAPAGPIIVNDTLFVGSQDSNVYAVPLTDFAEAEQKSEEEGSATESEDTVKDDDNRIMKYVIVGVLAVVFIIVLITAIVKRKNK